MLDDLCSQIRTRIETRISQIRRVAAQQHGMSIDETTAANVFAHIIENELRFASLLAHDEVSDAEIAMLITITRVKAAHLFTGDNNHANRT